MDVKSDRNNRKNIVKKTNKSTDNPGLLSQASDCSQSLLTNDIRSSNYEQMQNETSSQHTVQQNQEEVIDGQEGSEESSIKLSSDAPSIIIESESNNQEKNQTNTDISSKQDECSCQEGSSMESTAYSLLERLHRLQGRQSQRHLHRTIGGFVRREQTSTGLGCQIRVNVSPSQQQTTTTHLVNHHHNHLPVNNFLITSSVCPASSSSSIKDHPIPRSSSHHHNAVSNERLKGSSSKLDLVYSNGQSSTVPSSSSTTFTNITNVNCSSKDSGVSFNLPGNNNNSPSLVKLLINRSSSLPVCSSLENPIDPSLNSQIPVESSSESAVLFNNINGQGPQASSKKTGKPLLPIDPDTVETHSGILKYNLKLLEEDYDSDATDSSSGGESVADDFGFSVLTDEEAPMASFQEGNSSFSPGLSRQSTLLYNQNSYPQSPVPTSSRKHSVVASSM
jgi:hypothetical protein